MSKTSSLRLRGPLILLLLCFITSIILFWPGILSPDGTNQYAAARAGVYSDHHPPMMSFVWRYLDMVYPGPGLMLLFHLAMLYAACAIFIFTFKDSKFKWWFAIFPFIPNILSYTPLIVKDIGFTYSYLLSGAILSYMMVNKLKKYKYTLITLIVLLLFYGTCVKYQARFLLIFLTLGVTFCFEYKFSKRSILSGVVLYLLLLQAMFSFNNQLVSDVQKSHSWQFVKLYDLAAISLDLDQPMFPDFVKHNPDFSFNEVKKIMQRDFVDLSKAPVDLSQPPASVIMKIGSNERQRSALLNYWRSTVIEHPVIYLKYRLRLWLGNIIGVPSLNTHPASFFKNTALGPFLNQPTVYEAIGIMFKMCSIALQFVWLLPLLLLYTYLSIVKINKSRYATPLLMFSFTSLSMLLVLFFFSIASTARYVFIATCFVHASHAFAYKCWKER